MGYFILVVSQVILYQVIGTKLSQQGTKIMTHGLLVIVRRVTKADGGIRRLHATKYSSYSFLC